MQWTSNSGHFGDNINSVALSFVERLSSLGGSKCIVGASDCVLCTEVFCTVSSFGGGGGGGTLNILLYYYCFLFQ